MNSDVKNSLYGMGSLILDNIRCRPLRAFIAILSIAVALGGAMTMVGTSESLESTLVLGYESRQVDLMVMQANKTNPMTSRIDTSISDEILAIDGVESVQALLADSLLVDSNYSIMVYGWPSSYQEVQYQRDGKRVILNHGDAGITDQQKRVVTHQIEQISPILKVVTTDEFLADNQLTSAVRGLGHVILISNILLSILIVSTIMVLSVSERRNEIAIFRAIGWSAWQISWLVILETTVISATAAVMGGLIGWTGLEISLSHLQTLGVYTESVVTIEQAVWLVLSAILIALFGAALPIYYALNISI
ncbi:MAG: ABC transporter permease, partial [Candidatus Thiodiazotropha sp. 6PLUC5]